MKNISKIKKIFSMILLIAVLINATQPVFAASGTGTWYGGQFASYMFTTDFADTEYGVLIRNLTNYNTGERRTVFCAECGIDFTTGSIYDGEFFTPTNTTIRKACKIAYLGWYSKYGDYLVDDTITAPENQWIKQDYIFTQQFIWETLGQSNATFVNGNLQAEYINFKNNIENRIAEMERRPSFDSSTVTIQAGNSITLTDSNGVFSKYESVDRIKDGIRFVHNKGNNDLTIYVDENTDIENYNISDSTFKNWGLIREDTQDRDTMIYFSFRDGVQNQLYSMHYNDPISLRLSLKIELFGKLELTKLDTDEELIDGAVFNVIGPNNYNKDVIVENGKIIIEKLKKGVYTIKEKSAPDGYLLDTETYSVEIKPNQISSQSVINTEPTGTISIIKKDFKTGSVPQGDAKLAGAVYKVFANEDIYNKARTQKFYSKGELVAIRTINQEGTTEDITNLPLGRYIVKEEVAPEGYLLDTNEYDVSLVYKDQNTPIISSITTSLEKVKEMGVHVFKSGIKEISGVITGLEGVEFTIKLKSAVERAYEQGYTYAEVWNGLDEDGNKILVDSKRVAQAQVIAPTYEVIETDKDGNAYTQNKLPYGKFIVKETKTPIDYESSNDFTFSITDDESEIKEISKKIKHLVVNNEQLESYIKMIKKDLKTEKNVTLNSTTFEIKATNDIYDRATKKILFKKGEVISQKVGNTTYTSFTTNADNIVIPDNSYINENDNKSEIITPLKLPVGSYEINELKVPDGFLKLEKAVTFEIKNIKDYDTDKDGDFIKEVVIKNEQPTGTLKLDKAIAIRDNVDTSVIDISDLSKIEFKLTAKEDITDKADGSLIYSKGQEVNKYNLTREGNLIIADLPMGAYEIEETQTLDGLVLNRNKYEVKFEQKDLVTKVYDKKLDITNDTTLIEISKTDVTGENELVGARLTVFDSENKVIDTWISSDTAHKIEGLIVGKEYMLKEEIAPDGYVVAKEVKFTINNTNEIQKIIMIDKLVEVTKTDLITGEELEGAKLEVVNEDGNIIDKWVSIREPHKVQGLEEGKTYILKETTAPYGYEITEEIKFVVTTDKETQKIEMKDIPVLKNVKVIKIDSKTKETINDKFTFAMYEDPECTKLIKEVQSNKEDGTVLFEKLRFGTYYIKEIESPKDYKLSNKIIKVKINEKGIFVDEEYLEEDNNTIEFNFENQKVEVPETGDESKIQLMISIIFLSILGIVYICIKNYKKAS